MSRLPRSSTAADVQERRRYPRWSRSLNLSVAGHDRRGLFYLDPVRTIDVSRGGVSFPLARPVLPGSKVWIQLSDRGVDGPPLERRGRVCRVDRFGSRGAGRRVAVSFEEPLPPIFSGA